MKVRAIPHNSKCRYGERGVADAKPKACLIEHFGNADLPIELCGEANNVLAERKNYIALLKSN